MTQMNNLKQHITEFLNTNPRNKIVFSRQTEDAINLGKELSDRIKQHLNHERLSMKTKDLIDEIIKANINTSDEIEKHIIIKNFGILFEPELKINFEHFLKTYSSENTLVIEWPGEITNNQLFFLSKEKGLKADLKNLTYSIYEV